MDSFERSDLEEFSQFILYEQAARDLLSELFRGIVVVGSTGGLCRDLLVPMFPVLLGKFRNPRKEYLATEGMSQEFLSLTSVTFVS